MKMDVSTSSKMIKGGVSREKLGPKTPRRSKKKGGKRRGKEKLEKEAVTSPPPLCLSVNNTEPKILPGGSCTETHPETDLKRV